MLFNHDWWFGNPYAAQIELAKQRCAADHFPNLNDKNAKSGKAHKKFYDGLEVRTILYLRDNFSYEMKEIIRTNCTTALTFECVPADEAYKVGCFIVSIPFEDIVRVEIYAVHPDEKPEDMPSIKGFSSASGSPVRQQSDDTLKRRDGHDSEA